MAAEELFDAASREGCEEASIVAREDEEEDDEEEFEDDDEEDDEEFEDDDEEDDEEEEEGDDEWEEVEDEEEDEDEEEEDEDDEEDDEDDGEYADDIKDDNIIADEMEGGAGEEDGAMPSANAAVSEVPAVSAAPAVSEAAVSEAAVSEPESVPAVGPRVLSYKERIEKAMRTLDERRAEYLMMESEDPKGRLATYSTKLAKMLENIEKSKGSNLVYSQFKTVEGLGVLGVALKANGYDEIKIVGTEQNPKFSDDTIASFRDGLGDVDRPKRKRFISFTGEGSKEQRALVLNIFNGNFDKLPAEMRVVLEPFKEKKNTTGDICWVIGITGAGAEGISLKCCRSVHIMEPYWNNVRLDQVKGRAIRICSHKDLPFKDREVEIYTYYTVFSEEQKRSDKIDQTIRGTDNNETSDEKVFYVSIKKDKINQEILKLMKESAVDCELNAGENDGIQCFRIEGQATQYLFDPNLEVDKIVTSIELKEVRGDLQSRVSRALDVSAPVAPVVDRIKVIRIRGTEYLLKPAEGTTTEFLLYGRNDTTFVGKKFGTLSSDPSTGRYTGLHLYET
jgi:hypothetical protein